MGSITLTEVRRSVTERLDKSVYEVGLFDLVTAVRQTAAQVIQEQRDLGNPPTSLLVDGRSRKDGDTSLATKRVQAFFADKEALRKAVYEAWNRIQALTRVATGSAASSYQLWYNENKIGITPAAVEIYLERFNPAKDYFRIVGPVVVYGRKVYWNPKGKPKLKKIRLLRTKTSDIKLVRVRGIMDQVEQSMRRRYRYLAIAEDWVKTSALPKDGRTPALWLGFKKKGTLLRV